MIQEKKEYKRRISLEQDFMNYSIDDRLFGALYHLATYHPEKEVYYLTKKKFQENKMALRCLCTSNKDKEAECVSTQQLTRLMTKLKENNLITEGKIVSNKKQVDAYIFPKPSVETQSRYQLIENEMLWYVVSTRNKQAVKIYTYLLNKHLWKQLTQDTYVFTKRELLEAIGYSKTSNNNLMLSMVGNILESFQREGVIQLIEFFEDITAPNGKVVPSHRYRLLDIQTKRENDDKKV